MKYRRVIIPKPGNSDVLQVVEDTLPNPQPGEVCVKVLAAGVARADILMRNGQYPEAVSAYPFTPGYDIAGVVSALGSSATTFNIGDKVVALTETGGYAEYVCLSEQKLVSFPDELDPAMVVCLPLNYITAYQTLHRFAGVQNGEQVLIHAAASGVGTALLQLGMLAELKMYATASRAKHDVIAQFGAVPIDYQVDDFVERIHALTRVGVDAAFDPVGGSHIYRSFKALNEHGRLIAYGEMAITGDQAGNFNEIALHHDLPQLLNDLPGDRLVRWYECFVENQAHFDWYLSDLIALVELLEKGKISPVIAGRFTLDEASHAHNLIEDAAVIGKIVLVFT